MQVVILGRMESALDPLIGSILSKIEFRFVREMEPGRFDPYEGRAAPTYFQAADVANTMIHDEAFALVREPLLLGMTRGTTVAGAYLLHRLVEAMPPEQVYLNVGVWHGFSYFAPLVGNPSKVCIGVDHFREFAENSGRAEFQELYARFRRDGAEFYELDFREFFPGFTRKVGVYYYDGDHSYQAHLDALRLAHPHLVPGSYVVIDDIDRPDVYGAVFDFLGREGQFSNYEIVLDRKTHAPFHPTWHCGILVLKKVR